MKRQISLLIFIVALGSCFAQERPSFIDTRCENFTTDIQDNIYIWRESTLEKYSSEGEFLCAFSSPAFGDIAVVDASTPSKVLVFYKEGGIILFLDNKLNSIGNELNLFEHDLFSISLTALCNTNHIVLYDESAHDLIITDLNLNIKSTTHCRFEKTFSPFSIEVNFDKEIMLVDSTSGIYLFDKFGTFEKSLPFHGITSAQLFGNDIIYYKNSSIYRYDKFALDNILILSGVSNIKKFEKTKCYIYTLVNKGYLYRTPITR